MKMIKIIVLFIIIVQTPTKLLNSKKK